MSCMYIYIYIYTYTYICIYIERERDPPAGRAARPWRRRPAGASRRFGGPEARREPRVRGSVDGSKIKNTQTMKPENTQKRTRTPMIKCVRNKLLRATSCSVGSGVLRSAAAPQLVEVGSGRVLFSCCYSIP